MTYEEAMLLAIAGYTVRRVAWHSPKQFVVFRKDHKYREYRNFSGGWFPKEEDLVAEDWHIDESPDYWEGWYYPAMIRNRKRKRLLNKWHGIARLATT